MSAFLRHAACAVLLAGLPAAAVAERFVLDPLTVTATRYARPLSDVPASVTVLEAADLAPLADLPLEDILATHAGVTLARSGGPGQQVSVFLRGTDSDSVLVLVDGVKLNGEAFGGASLQNLRGADIARLEVVRGPRSALYGSEAIGGVISITTRRPADAPGTQAALRLAGGSDDTREWRASASHAGAAGNGLRVSAGEFRTAGDPLTERTDLAGRYRNRSATLGGEARSGDTRYGIDAWSAQGSTRYVDCVYDAFFNCTGIVPYDQAFRNAVVALWAESALDESTTVQGRLGHAADELDQEDSADFAQTRRASLQFDLHRRLTAGLLGGGVEVEREDVDAVIYGAPVAGDNDIRSAWARGEWHPGRHRIALGARSAEYGTFGGHTTGEASWSLPLGEQRQAWLAWAEGFRAPTTTDRFGYGGNPLLQPETTQAVEAGLRQRVGRQLWSLSGFRQDIDDLIVCMPLPPPSFDCVATNIDSARITGTELAWSWRRAGTALELQGTWLDAVDAATGRRLSRRPQTQLNAAARHTRGPLELRASLLAMDSRDNSPYDAVRLPGFAVVDLGAAWRLSAALSVDLRVENAGDIEYALASGAPGDYRMPDRAYFIGIDWRH